MLIKFSASGNKIRGVYPGLDFFPALETFKTYSNGAITETPDKDSVIRNTEGIGVTDNLRITCGGNASYQRNYTRDNLKPAVADLIGDSLIMVSNGIAEVMITDSLTRSKKKISGPVMYQGTAAISAFDRFVTGSLGRHVTDFVDSVISGKTAVYQGVNQATQNIFASGKTRNPSHILSGVDITGISAPHDYYAEGWEGGVCATVISPRHIISADHWHMGVGRKQYFVAGDNTVIERTVVNGINPYPGTDFWIGYLDAALPASIKPFKVLPSNFLSKYPTHTSISLGSTSPIPAFLCFNSTGDLHIGAYDWSEAHIGNSMLQEHQSITYKDWFKGGAYGSGSIVFTVINEEAVALFCLHRQGYTGPTIANAITEINAAMTTLHGSSEYQLTTIDLSGFSTY